MIGIKVKLKGQIDIDNDIYEVISEPYVATKDTNPQTFVTVFNLRTNKIFETNMYTIDEMVSETQYKNWSQK